MKQKELWVYDFFAEIDTNTVYYRVEKKMKIMIKNIAMEKWSCLYDAQLKKSSCKSIVIHNSSDFRFPFLCLSKFECVVNFNNKESSVSILYFLDLI